jgi:hypothetical protein
MGIRNLAANLGWGFVPPQLTRNLPVPPTQTSQASGFQLLKGSWPKGQ